VNRLLDGDAGAGAMLEVVAAATTAPIDEPGAGQAPVNCRILRGMLIAPRTGLRSIFLLPIVLAN